MTAFGAVAPGNAIALQSAPHRRKANATKLRRQVSVATWISNLFVSRFWQSFFSVENVSLVGQQRDARQYGQGDEGSTLRMPNVPWQLSMPVELFLIRALLQQN